MYSDDNSYEISLVEFDDDARFFFSVETRSTRSHTAAKKTGIRFVAGTRYSHGIRRCENPTDFVFWEEGKQSRVHTVLIML